MRDPTLAGVAEALSHESGAKCAPMPERTVSGGSINTCYQWRSSQGMLFVKVAAKDESAMLEAEAAGLGELASAKAVRVPRVAAQGVTQRVAFLALEWIDPRPPRTAEATLGQQLARQHRVTAPDFGWQRDNTIGRTPQLNGRMGDWIEFFRERRLRYQLDLATRNGYGAQLESGGSRLLEHVGEFFTTYRPVPSLLHGDLWGGNWFADPADHPVIFDPATYYGDREADIAMTHLFGGFGRKFYEAYEAAWPLDEGHSTRRPLYNLYHVLNHANLFGGSYAQQARQLIDQLLAQVR
jgi:protein-ribulosamine 3-kinase